MPEIKKISVEIGDGGERYVSIEAVMPRGEELEPDDVPRLLNLLEEANGSETSEEEEAEPEKPKRQRRRSKKVEEPEEEEAEERPKRRRRSKKDEEPEEEEAEERPKRRRRSKKDDSDDDGPTKEDVAKVASDAAEVLGAKFTGQIIADYSKTGKLDDIPAKERQKFIDEVNLELEDGD